ncbi:hypothetical protein DENSPDRAFT_136590 [Dentipellis sp. KUC8613]|nr:hypothetical protein DENSPDRAFT_136590 [Dentipellis sp. KUC8613]
MTCLISLRSNVLLDFHRAIARRTRRRAVYPIAPASLYGIGTTVRYRCSRVFCGYTCCFLTVITDSSRFRNTVNIYLEICAARSHRACSPWCLFTLPRASRDSTPRRLNL